MPHESHEWTHLTRSVFRVIGDARAMAARDAIVANAVTMTAYMLRLSLRIIQKPSASGNSASFYINLEISASAHRRPYRFENTLMSRTASGFLD